MGKKKEGGSKKKSGVRPTTAKYHTDKTREKHKLKRVLQSSGVEAARAFAELHNLMSHLHRLPLYLKKTKPLIS